MGRSCGHGWVILKYQGECTSPLLHSIMFTLFRSVDGRWKGLRNAFAGLCCAFTGSLDDMQTTIPSRSFQPKGSLPHFHSNTTYQLRHASPLSEHVCTKNLTPSLKQLLCKATAGIAALLNPHRLLDADWHRMSVHVTWDCATRGVHLQLSV